MTELSLCTLHPRQDQEAAGSVDVERVMHWMVGTFHLVNELGLHTVADREPPLDGMVLATALSVDQLPNHVAGVHSPVDVRHQVLPLQAIVLLAPMNMGRKSGRDRRGRGDQLHAAFGAGGRCLGATPFRTNLR